MEADDIVGLPTVVHAGVIPHVAQRVDVRAVGTVVMQSVEISGSACTRAHVESLHHVQCRAGVYGPRLDGEWTAERDRLSSPYQRRSLTPLFIRNEVDRAELVIGTPPAPVAFHV